MHKDATKYHRACAKFLRCPPSKAAIRARTLTGLPVSLAISMLKYSPTSSARLILSVLNSAVANATNRDGGADVDELVVAKICVDRGPMLKRHHPISHGTAQAILKRTCHISVELKSALAYLQDHKKASGKGRPRKKKS